jgi:hypothetical protein
VEKNDLRKAMDTKQKTNKQHLHVNACNRKRSEVRLVPPPVISALGR